MERERKIKLITSLCVCFLFALILVVIGQVVSIVTLNHKKAQLAAELAKLEEDKTSVEALIKFRESDRYVEQYAREILGMGREEKNED